MMGDQLEGLSLEQVNGGRRGNRRVPCSLVAGSLELAGHDWLLAINSPEFLALEGIYQQCWPAVLDFIGDRMSNEFKATGDRMATRVSGLLHLIADRPRTAVHGDYRADNLFFTLDDGGLAVVDWADLESGELARFDLAYLLSGSLTVDMRRQHEMALLALYHQTLVAKGVGGYSFEDCLSDYRLNVMLGWAWPVVAIGSLDTANERGVALFHAWADRVMSAVVDLEAQVTLPA